jgi:hypothetical protein
MRIIPAQRRTNLLGPFKKSVVGKHECGNSIRSARGDHHRLYQYLRPVQRIRHSCHLLLGERRDLRARELRPHEHSTDVRGVYEQLFRLYYLLAMLDAATAGTHEHAGQTAAGRYADYKRDQGVREICSQACALMYGSGHYWRGRTSRRPILLRFASATLRFPVAIDALFVIVVAVESSNRSRVGKRGGSPKGCHSRLHRSPFASSSS